MEQGKRKMFKMVRIVVGFFLSLNLATLLAFSQELPEEPVKEAGKAELFKENITIDFKSADIRNVLRLLAEKSGINIIVGEEVEGKVTVKLVDVPWKKALDVILKSQGLVYECDDSIIRITTVENLKKEDLVTRVFDLNYANSEEVSKAIENMLGPRGKINFDERMNLLIITDVSANLGKIGEVVKRLDARTPQVLVEARIVEVTLSKGEDLGINWSVLKNFSVGVKDIKETYERTKESSRTSSRDFASESAEATGDKREIVNKTVNKTTDESGKSTTYIDKSTTPWTITTVVTPAQSTFEDTTEDTDTRTKTPYDKSTSLTETFKKVSSHSDASKYVQTAVLTISDFNLVLSALKARGDFNLVSNPKIVTTDNQEARMFVGENVPIPIYERNKETGTMEITGYDDEKVGITLLVTPSINEDKYITLKVHPEISEIIGSVGPHNERPVTSKREAETTVVINNGDTLAIGGLISDSERKGIKKVPLLGDIPFLGWLFKHRTTEMKKTDLIIFITPTILGVEESK